jgi:tetratricopeptide (TPR) repeat protein
MSAFTHELPMPVIIRHNSRSFSLLLLLATLLALPWTVDAQRPFATTRDSISEAAAKLLNAGRGNEARILLQKARGSSSREQRVVYRLEVGNSYLYDGLYVDALRTYDAVLASGDAKGIDSLTSWAHRGMGLAEAFAGRETRGAAHLAQALASPGDSRFALGDSLEMLIITGQHDDAAKVLDRMASSRDDEVGQQYVQAFRGLNSMMAGHCTAALAEIAKAPRQDRPLPLAVRGRCAAKHGQRAESLVLRDSVLGHPTPDPFAWTMIIARDAARKIK